MVPGTNHKLTLNMGFVVVSVLLLFVVGGVLLLFSAGKGVDFDSVARFSSMNLAGGNVLLHYPKVGPV